jgi:hypothetical protein
MMKFFKPKSEFQITLNFIFLLLLIFQLQILLKVQYILHLRSKKSPPYYGM